MNPRLWHAVAAILLLSATWSIAGEPEQAVSGAGKESYSLGYEFGANLRRQEIDIDRERVILGLIQGLQGAPTVMTPDEIRSTLLALRKKVLVTTDRRIRETMAKNKAESEAFLETNRARAGVKTLPSGLQYRVLREGNGPVPKGTDIVLGNYRGNLVDGTEFDSSSTRGSPAEVRVNSVTRGWTEALQLMPEGSVWQIFLPPELAYGERQFGRIPPNSALVFDLELVKIKQGGVAD